MRKSVGSNVVVDLPGEESFPQRAEWNEADAELRERRKNLLFRFAPPDGVLALQRRQRLHRMRAPDVLHPRLGHSEVLHLPLRDELLHGAGDFFDRNFRIVKERPRNPTLC